MDLTQLQNEHEIWERKNFPDSADDVMHSLVGMLEELGELAHAVLKMAQGIRGSEQEHRNAAADAVGDINVYCAGLCNKLNLNMDECIEVAWGQVKNRDWTKNKVDGVVAS
jgi:NTP pyrophosphatase (non-canonical NTP hydrolase)